MVQSPTRANPFPGLRPFELDEDYLFFGREGQSDALLERLGRTHFLAVVGTSGIGKSSLVRAGLLPSLYSGFLAEATSTWRVAVLRPGGGPMRNLAAALNDPEVFGVAPSSPKQMDEAVIRTALTESTLRRGARGLVEVTEQARMEPSESLLVVVDQFEELFRFKQRARGDAQTLAAEDEASAFVKLLLTAVGQRSVPIFVVLTMRSDFLGDCAQFRDLPEALNDSQYLIPRLTREQLRRAIEGPVAVGGATITPRLVNRLLNDVGENPDQLPILQHALMRTWDYWTDQNTPNDPIDLPHYEATGGMAQALSRHADQIYEGLPDDRARQIAERLFKRLTDRGADNREIRRPTTLAELCAVAEASPEEMIAVIDEFRGARRSFLMPPLQEALQEETVIDISHESLMRNWQRLKGWVGEEAESASTYRRLAETAALHGQGQANYLRDPELTNGLNWRERQRPSAAWAARYAVNFDEAIAFLLASAEAKDADAERKERARRKEVNRLRSFLAVLAGLSVLTTGVSVFAFNQQKEAKVQAQRAEDSAQEAEEQKQQADEQRAIAILEKNNAETARTEAEARTIEAEDAKEEAEDAEQAEAEQRLLAEDALQRAEEGEAEATRQAEIANQQTTIAEENANAAEAATQDALAATREAEVLALNADIRAESLTVENLMAANLNMPAMRKVLALGRRIKELEGIPFLVARAKSNLQAQNASTLPKSDLQPSNRLQAVSVLRELHHLDGFLAQNSLADHSNWVYSVSFSPDGSTVASASDDGTVKLWDRSGRVLQTLGGQSGIVWSVSFSPDGSTVASASRDGTVKLWEHSGRVLQTLEGHSGGVWSVSFSPDGSTIASASEDGTVKLWDRSGRELQTLADHSDWVRSVSFSPDGSTVASASEDGTVKLWDRSGRELQTLEGHSSGVRSVSFSPDGSTIASASADGTVILWNFDLDDLMAKTCHWLHDYINNPATPPDDKALCEGVPAPSQLSSQAVQSPFLGAFQALVNVGRWLKG